MAKPWIVDTDGQTKSIGFDYQNQARVINGRYEDCAHPKAMACGCYGRKHAGESVAANAQVR